MPSLSRRIAHVDILPLLFLVEVLVDHILGWLDVLHLFEEAAEQHVDADALDEVDRQTRCLRELPRRPLVFLGLEL